MDTKKLRQKILDLAIRGKLVPQDPNDEPASVLLERIRAEKERLIKEGKIKRSKKSASDTPHYENVPFEIPDSWEWSYVESFTYDLQYGTSEKSSNEGDVPVLRMGNISRIGTIDFTDLVYSSNKDDISKYALLKNDLLFNRTNSSEWVGKTAIFKSDSPAIYAGYLIRVRCILVCPDYINFALNSSYHRDWCNIVKTDAVNQSNINAQKLSQHLIPIPPYEEQLRIVTETKKWLNVIDKIVEDVSDFENVISKTKTKILDLAIHGKLVPQDLNDEPAIVLLKRINPKFTPCDNAHYENNTIKTPENWEWVKLSDIAVTELGKTLDKGKNSGTPHNYLCAFNVKWCSFDLSVIKKILLEDEELERYRVRKGDLLICEGGDVGRAAIWESDQDIYYQNALHRVRFKDEINQHFYLYVLQYYKSLGMIDDVSSGVTIKHFTQNSMKKLSFPLPPIKEQYRIVSAINQYNTLLDNISANL